MLVTKTRFRRFAGNPIGNRDPFLPRACAVCARPTSPKYAKHRVLSQTSNYLILPFLSQTRTIMYRVRQHQGSRTQPRKSNNPKGVEYTVRVFDFRSGALSWGAQRETLRDHRGALGRQVLRIGAGRQRSRFVRRASSATGRRSLARSRNTAGIVTPSRPHETSPLDDGRQANEAINGFGNRFLIIAARRTISFPLRRFLTALWPRHRLTLHWRSSVRGASGPSGPRRRMVL